MNFLVTGGSRGIGEAIVLQAVQEGHGVAFTYLEQSDRAAGVVDRAQKARCGARVKAYKMDIRRLILGGGNWRSGAGGFREDRRSCL